jgi:DNA-binding XRE family transcriptional regulator
MLRKNPHMSIIKNNNGGRRDFFAMGNIYNASNVMLNSLGEKLRALRFEKEMTISEVASKLNIGTMTLCEYELGHRDPIMSNILKLAEFYDISVNYLFGYTNEKAPFLPREKN